MRVLHLSPVHPDAPDASRSPGTAFSTHDWRSSRYWQSRYEGRAPEVAPFRILASTIGPGYSVIDEQLDELFASGKRAAEVLKEYVFEDVRRSEFPDLPSRMTCLFAFPAHMTEDDALVAVERMAFLKSSDASPHDLVRLAIDPGARVHSGDSSLLNCNSLPPSAIAERAREYWRSAGVSDELLVSGRIEIVEVVRRLEPSATAEES